MRPGRPGDRGPFSLGTSTALGFRPAPSVCRGMLPPPIPTSMTSTGGGGLNLFSTYRTRDGGRHGRHGKVLHHPVDQGWSYFFLNASTGWLSDGQGLRRTTDGGDRWSVVNRRTGIGPGFAFVSRRVGFMPDTRDLSTGGILRSADGGRTWQRIRARLIRHRTHVERAHHVRPSGVELNGTVFRIQRHHPDLSG